MKTAQDHFNEAPCGLTIHRDLARWEKVEPPIPEGFRPCYLGESLIDPNDNILQLYGCEWVPFKYSCDESEKRFSHSEEALPDSFPTLIQKPWPEGVALWEACKKADSFSASFFDDPESLDSKIGTVGRNGLIEQFTLLTLTAKLKKNKALPRAFYSSSDYHAHDPFLLSMNEFLGEIDSSLFGAQTATLAGDPPSHDNP